MKDNRIDDVIRGRLGLGWAAAGLQSLAGPSGKQERRLHVISKTLQRAGEQQQESTAAQELRLQAGACGTTIGDWLHPPDRHGASCKVRGILGHFGACRGSREGPGVASHRRAPVDGALRAPPGCTGAAQSSVAQIPPWRIAGASAAIAQMAPTTPFLLPFLQTSQAKSVWIKSPSRARNPTLRPLFMCD